MLASLPWVQPVPPAMEDSLDLFSQTPVALPTEFNPAVGQLATPNLNLQCAPPGHLKLKTAGETE